VYLAKSEKCFAPHKPFLIKYQPILPFYQNILRNQAIHAPKSEMIGSFSKAFECFYPDHGAKRKLIGE